MGLFKKILERKSSKDISAHASSSSPPTQSVANATNSNLVDPLPSRSHGRNNVSDDDVYLAPPGPPPSYHNDRNNASEDGHYLPPPGPPPSQRQPSSDHQTGSISRQQDEIYLPPPGPPRTQRQPDMAAYDRQDEYQPPPGPPPGHSEEPPQYHDWQTAVPDTSLLPPPPAAANDISRTSNADSSQADAARQWCRINPLRQPDHPTAQQASTSQAGAVKLMSPGPRNNASLTELGVGSWSGATTNRATDLCFATGLPLYFALGERSPKLTGKQQTIYFEVHLNYLGKPDLNGNEPSLAIGFVAAPYPTWRMPGWERGSVAVHSDDGCRYVNNQDGGLDFVEPFKPGDVVGLGIKYELASWGGGATGNVTGEAFFTRNGQVEGTWSLQEETDAADRLGNLGIEGDHDLYGAIGTYGEVGFKAIFSQDGWAYKMN